MATLTNLLSTSSISGHLRPFDVSRDMRRVADLVEKCFADTLDPDGERYLQQMRAAANNPGFLRWAASAAEWASIPLSGYVWEEDGQLVGNVSVIPFRMKGWRYYMIANVGVHPDYRRRGIARSLTQQAVEHARRRGATAAWLHVRENNTPAVTLYKSLGFIERARRTTWISNQSLTSRQLPLGTAVVPRRPQDWSAQQVWLQQAYPPEVTWNMPLNLSALRPGIGGVVRRFFTAADFKQWSMLENGQLVGVMTWQASRSFADALWLAIDPEHEDSAAKALLIEARRYFGPHRSLGLDFPARRAEMAIQDAGFYAHQTLIWMSVSFS